MNQAIKKNRQVILAPVITDKSTKLAAEKCYVFRVEPSANKYQIALAFTELFGGKVLGVNTTARRSKRKRTKKGYVMKADGKKAYIYTNIELDLFPKL